jgi:endonuclease YncB( thermonuclease family)
LAAFSVLPPASVFAWTSKAGAARSQTGAARGHLALTAPTDLKPGRTGIVAAILSGDTVDLETGERVRLAGLQAPKLGTTSQKKPRGDEPRYQPWPLASEASARLGELVLGKRVRLLLPDDPEDRWGRILAHLVLESDRAVSSDETETTDGDWVQGRLLMEGMARVQTYPRTANGARAMLDLERTARAADLGIWADPFYRVRNPDETWDDLDSVQLVEGRVVDAAEVRGTGYLNFGRDWRRDFTFRIKPKAKRLFRRSGIDIKALTRKRVRGRGWVFPNNGPMIDLTHPEQLEVLEE